MLKLKALQAAQQKKEETAASPGAAGTPPAAGAVSAAGAASSSASAATSNGSGPAPSSTPVKDPMATDAAKAAGTTNVLVRRPADAKGGGNKKKTARQNAAELRVQKDLSEMPNVPGIEVTFANPENIMHFNVNITPKDGLYIGAKFVFVCNVPTTYPYDPPKVTCETLVYHPNIDWEGHVCLNILRQEWMPVLSLGSVVFGLMTLFLEPNPEDPLNKEAAKLMIERPQEFQRNVKASLRGGYVLGRNFPRLIS